MSAPRFTLLSEAEAGGLAVVFENRDGSGFIEFIADHFAVYKVARFSKHQRESHISGLLTLIHNQDLTLAQIKLRLTTMGLGECYDIKDLKGVLKEAKI